MVHKRYILFGVFCLCFGLAACSQAPTQYYPLTQGRTWTYQLSIKTAGGQEGDATLKVTNLAARKLRGRIVTPQKAKVQFRGEAHFEFDYMAQDRNGIYTYAEQGPRDVEPQVKTKREYTLKLPIKVGTSWSSSVDLPGSNVVPGKATIEGVGETVDVPAGTFNGCVKVHIVGAAKGTTGDEQYLWFAPSVGMVKEISRAGGVAGSFELTSFTK